MAAFVRAPRGPGARKITEVFLLLRGNRRERDSKAPETTDLARVSQGLWTLLLRNWPRLRRRCLACAGRLRGGGDFKQRLEEADAVVHRASSKSRDFRSLAA